MGFQLLRASSLKTPGKGPSQVSSRWTPSHRLSSSFYTCDCLHAVASLALGL